MGLETTLALCIAVATVAVVFTSSSAGLYATLPPTPATVSLSQPPAQVKSAQLNLARIKKAEQPIPVDTKDETRTLSIKATKITPPSGPVVEQLPADAEYKAVEDVVNDEGVIDLAGKEYTHLSMWDPVAENFTRKLRLDDTGKVYTMRTVAVNPPVFEIEDFLDESDCDSIIRLASDNGLIKSKHVYLDGSNANEEDLDTSALSDEKAEELFRYSDQTWLGHNSAGVLREMYSRVQALTRLPQQTIQKMEPLQVVRYRRGGHYESHYDSEPKELGPCCADPVARKRGLLGGYDAMGGPVEKRCRICRFMTVLYYLDDTEEGGGTVFPLADLTEEEMVEFRASTDPLKFKQTRACAPGKVVMPKKRKAVLWYNHHIDRGFLGDRHERSLHGGCNIVKGTKWIANHWITELTHPDEPRNPAIQQHA